MSNRGTNYSATEHAALCAAYVSMAVEQNAGRKVNKAAIIRDLIATVCPTRSRGSIEAKFMNISAAAISRNLLPGLPGGHVQGYKPAPNGSKSLADDLTAALHANRAAWQLVIERGYGRVCETTDRTYTLDRTA